MGQTISRTVGYTAIGCGIFSLVTLGTGAGVCGAYMIGAAGFNIGENIACGGFD